MEFKSRREIADKPVTDMIGYRTHGLPAGTFSDDSSMTFCLAEALTCDFDLQILADNFVRWVRENYWTPLGTVFDIGIATSLAIARLEKGCDPVLAGGMEEGDNGNGSFFYYLEFARLLAEGVDKFDAYKILQIEVPAFWRLISAENAEISVYSRLLEGGYL